MNNNEPCWPEEGQSSGANWFKLRLMGPGIRKKKKAEAWRMGEAQRERGQSSALSWVWEEARGGGGGRITQILPKICCCRSQGTVRLRAVHCRVTPWKNSPFRGPLSQQQFMALMGVLITWLRMRVEELHLSVREAFLFIHVLYHTRLKTKHFLLAALMFQV